MSYVPTMSEPLPS